MLTFHIITQSEFGPFASRAITLRAGQAVRASAEGIVIATRTCYGLAASFAARRAAGPSLLRSRARAGWYVLGAATSKKITARTGAARIEFRAESVNTPTKLVPGTKRH